MKTIFIVIAFFSITASAELEQTNQEALQRVQRAMQDPEARKQIIDQNKDLQKMDGKIEEFSGTDQNKEQLYDLSSQVMKGLTEKNGGDAGAMKEALEKAEKNPEKFFKEYFTPEQQTAVRALANEIQKTNPQPVQKQD